LRNTSLCFYDVARYPVVQGHVALTIDDAPCRFARSNSRVKDVKDLLHEFGAKATFMLVGRFVDGHEEDLVELLKDGHEFGNHGMLDRAYHEDSNEEFAEAVDRCNGKINALQRLAGTEESVSWFRSPHGKYTVEMEGILKERGLTNVMTDTYASCPVVQDGEFIGNFLARNASHGSILLIHMPELGLREWCLEGLRILLEGLKRRNLKPITVGELAGLVESVA